MWRTVTGERGNSGARASPAPAPELSSLGLYPQDSPLLGLLSAVSRPAVSFLQRWSPFVPGRALKQDLMEQQSEFLPPQSLHSLPWFDLSELGIHSPDDPHRPEDSGLQAQTVVSHVLVHPPRAASKPWLGALWSEDKLLKPAGAGLLTTAFIHERATPGLSPAPGLNPALIHHLGLNALAPDPDNGYSSLEEEQLLAAKAQMLQSAGTEPAEEEEEEAVEEEEEAVEEEEEEVPVLKCNNKAIAFIMGCPCSDDSGSDSSEDEDDEDDDGFDSDGSSDVSDSDDEEEEFDSEAERLWSTLCQNHDPYNPRNFTAKLGSAPRPIPNSPRMEPGSSSSASSPSSSPSSCASSSSWDEASEAEMEGEKLLAAFRSSDPYSPLNFQASIRTKQRLELEPEQRVRTSSESSHRSSRTSNNSKKKKVRFLAEVRIFTVGCEERCGPWEELARDRARFAKRCSETELVLSSCLQLEHRRRVYLRLCQSESEE